VTPSPLPGQPIAEDGHHYGPTVLLPRRIKADLTDGAIGAAIMLVPLLIGQALTGVAPSHLLRLLLLAIPAGLVYCLVRDAIGRGTSFGKRALRLCLIRLEDGQLCGARRVWARNLLDWIPLVNIVDFVWMCADRHGQKIMDRRLRTQIIEAYDLGVHHVVTMPSPAAVGSLPSKARRLLAVLGYWVMSFVVLSLALALTLSELCVRRDRCSSQDHVVNVVLQLAWLAGLVAIAIAGWSGRLWGARRRVPGPATSPASNPSSSIS
jgi:hypothetical protein